MTYNSNFLEFHSNMFELNERNIVISSEICVRDKKVFTKNIVIVK